MIYWQPDEVQGCTFGATLSLIYPPVINKLHAGAARQPADPKHSRLVGKIMGYLCSWAAFDKKHHGHVLGSVQVPMCSYCALRFCFSTFHIILRLELSAGSYSGCWFLNAIPVCEGLQIVSNQSDCYSRFLVFGGPCRVGCGLLASKKTCNERMQSQVKVLTPFILFQWAKYNYGVLDSFPKSSMVSVCSAVPSFVL